MAARKAIKSRSMVMPQNLQGIENFTPMKTCDNPNCRYYDGPLEPYNDQLRCPNCGALYSPNRRDQ